MCARETITGKDNVSEYCNSWRERYVITKKVTEFEVKHSNYNYNSCLQLNTMVVLFMMNGNIINKKLLSSRYFSDEKCAYHDDLVGDYPFSYNYIKRHLEPLREENDAPIIKGNRIPRFSCGAKSETLDWYEADLKQGIDCYKGQVSICPKCSKVIEFFAEAKYRIEEPVFDKEGNDAMGDNATGQDIPATANIFADQGIEYHDILISSVVETNGIKDKS